MTCLVGKLERLDTLVAIRVIAVPVWRSAELNLPHQLVSISGLLTRQCCQPWRLDLCHPHLAGDPSGDRHGARWPLRLHARAGPDANAGHGPQLHRHWFLPRHRHPLASGRERGLRRAYGSLFMASARDEAVATGGIALYSSGAPKRFTHTASRPAALAPATSQRLDE